MAHLTEREKKELLEMAESGELCRDFRMMAVNSKKRKMSIDEYVKFLTTASKIFPSSNTPRKHITYRNAKI